MRTPLEQIIVDPDPTQIMAALLAEKSGKNRDKRIKNGKAYQEFRIPDDHEPEGKRLVESPRVFQEVYNLLQQGSGQHSDRQYKYEIELCRSAIIPRAQALVCLDLDVLTGKYDNYSARQKVADSNHLLRIRFNADCDSIGALGLTRADQAIWQFISKPDISLKNQFDPDADPSPPRKEVEGERRNISPDYLRDHFKAAVSRFALHRSLDLPAGMATIKSSVARVRSGYLCSRASYFAILTVTDLSDPDQTFRVLYEVTNDDVLFLDPELNVIGHDHELEYEAKGVLCLNSKKSRQFPKDVVRLLAQAERAFDTVLLHMPITGRHDFNTTSKVERAKNLVNEAWATKGQFSAAVKSGKNSFDGEEYYAAYAGMLNALSANLKPHDVLDRFGHKLGVLGQQVVPPAELLRNPNMFIHRP